RGELAVEEFLGDRDARSRRHRTAGIPERRHRFAFHRVRLLALAAHRFHSVLAQSIFAPVSFTTFSHFTMSVLMKASNSSGVEAMGLSMSCSMRALVTGVRIARTKSKARMEQLMLKPI